MPDRICLVRHGYYPGEARLERQTAALRSLGLDVDVICLKRRGTRSSETVDGVRVHRLPLEHRRSGVPRYLFEYVAFAGLAAVRLTRLHRRRVYAVVEVHTMPDFLVLAAVVPKLLGARVILDMHEVMPELAQTMFGKRGLGRVLASAIRGAERLAIHFADHVLTVSRPTHEVLVARGAPAEKLTIVMNSPDESLFRPRPPRKIDPSAPLIVAHGTLLERSGFQTVVAGFAQLRKRVPGARLRIFGKGEYEEPLRQLSASLGLGDAVEFAGFVPLSQVADEVARADIGIASNEVDAFTDLIVPTRLLEYVGVGLPSVTVPSRAVLHYFDETMVSLYRSGDPASLAAALERLIADPDHAAKMARLTADRLREFGWSRQREAYLAVVEGLRRAPGPPEKAGGPGTSTLRPP